MPFTVAKTAFESLNLPLLIIAIRFADSKWCFVGKTVEQVGDIRAACPCWRNVLAARINSEQVKASVFTLTPP